MHPLRACAGKENKMEEKVDYENKIRELTYELTKIKDKNAELVSGLYELRNQNNRFLSIIENLSIQNK